MRCKLLGSVLIVAASASNPSFAEVLVDNATIESISNSWFYVPLLNVSLADATGPCASTTVAYAEHLQGVDVEEARTRMNRHLAILLAAKVAGKKVSIEGSSCTGAVVTAIR